MRSHTSKHPVKSRHLFLLSTSLIGALAAFLPCQAYAIDSLATPAGESVAAGNVIFARPAPGQLNVTQSSDRAIIDWDSFDIGTHGHADFRQPGQSSLTVNRVMSDGTDPSQILGRLTSNGQLMVLNRNGVLFGQDARIDVGGIIASTGNIDDSAVMAGGSFITLDDFGDATVENRGHITTHEAGLAALIAPAARNSGVITARLGRVELASGGAQATVDLYGDNLIELALSGTASQVMAENTGRITAEGGTVAMTTGFADGIVDSLINMSGVASASSATRHGGRIILNGGAVNVLASGQLDTGSARRRGGNILIQAREDVQVHGILSTTGAARAGNITIAGGGGDRSVIGATAMVEANSANGHGGHIEMGADGGYLDVNGRITSRGRSGGGNIIIENGDNPVTIGKTARILSEAIHSGSGGVIEISSGEGDQIIGGQIRSIGKKGGSIEIRSRSGIDILENAVLDTHSRKYGGGAINLLVGEGNINNEGAIISRGKTSGGPITLYSSRVITTPGSLISSTGDSRGGTITPNGFEGISIAGDINADALKSGNGGRVTLNSEGEVLLSGDISARGGPQGGNGGTVTFTRPNTIAPGGSVDVSAPNGKNGSFNY